jgi:hypothetical protein
MVKSAVEETCSENMGGALGSYKGSFTTGASCSEEHRGGLWIHDKGLHIFIQSQVFKNMELDFIERSKTCFPLDCGPVEKPILQELAHDVDYDLYYDDPQIRLFNDDGQWFHFHIPESLSSVRRITLFFFRGIRKDRDHFVHLIWRLNLPVPLESGNYQLLLSSSSERGYIDGGFIWRHDPLSIKALQTQIGDEDNYRCNELREALGHSERKAVLKSQKKSVNASVLYSRNVTGLGKLFGSTKTRMSPIMYDHDFEGIETLFAALDVNMPIEVIWIADDYKLNDSFKGLTVVEATPRIPVKCICLDDLVIEPSIETLDDIVVKDADIVVKDVVTQPVDILTCPVTHQITIATEITITVFGHITVVAVNENDVPDDDAPPDNVPAPPDNVPAPPDNVPAPPDNVAVFVDDVAAPADDVFIGDLYGDLVRAPYPDVRGVYVNYYALRRQFMDQGNNFVDWFRGDETSCEVCYEPVMNADGTGPVTSERTKQGRVVSHIHKRCRICGENGYIEKFGNYVPHIETHHPLLYNLICFNARGDKAPSVKIADESYRDFNHVLFDVPCKCTFCRRLDKKRKFDL